MNVHIPPSRISRIVLTIVIACLLATFVSMVFVAAQRNDNKPSAVASANPNPTAPEAPAKARIAEHFGKLPLSFEVNKGQIDQPVKFLWHGKGYDLFLTSTEAVLRVQKPRAQQADGAKQPATADANVHEGTVLRLRMLGANANPQVEGQEELPGKINYFIGNDPAKWRRNIPTYRKAYFKDIYPGIDVVYYGTQRELEYDFVVGAGVDPKRIRFSVEGADQLRLDKTGRLLLGLKHGEVSLNKPVIYQLDENGNRREVKGAYVINGNEVRFKLDRFDSSKPLIIDPVLSYSTLLGSSNTDSATAIAVDSQGSAYVTGQTEFTGFPTTPGAFKSTATIGGAFVTKLDPTGSSLVYSTYLNGSNGSSNGFGIAVDSTGNAHIAGITSANDFPIANGIKTTSTFFKTTDAAVTWNNQNTGLVGEVNVLAVAPNAPSTVYASTSTGFYRSTDGGATWAKTPSTGLSSTSFASALAVDPTNSSIVYLGVFGSLFKSTDAGNSWTAVNATPVNFSSVSCVVFDPVTPATMYVGAANGVFKSTDSGSSWIVQNNFGVPGTPNVRALAIDPTTPLTVYAGTSNNGVFKSTNGGSVWTAMNSGMGGPSPTFINAIVIDPANPQTIYTGHGNSGGINKSTNGAASWGPLTNGVPQGSVTAMVVNSSGVYAAVSTGIIKSTNGGTDFSNANDGLWNTFVRALVGHPSNASILFVGTGSSFFSFDAFVTKLNASGSGLLFSTLLGGNSDDAANGIAVDANGNIYVTGYTNSLNFPVANAAQGPPPNSNTCNSAFVTKLNPSVPSYAFSTYLRGNSCETGYGIAVDSSGNVYVSGSTSSSDFLTVNAFQPAPRPQGSSDAFVTKLTTDGAVTYSTYLGGGSGETGYAITADSSGNAYVTGLTSSSNFPTLNPIQATNGGGFGGDVFVTKFNSQGSALVYSTYLGGSQGETARGIALDSANNVYITGSSDSLDFPLVTGALSTKSVIYRSTDGAANWSNDNYGFALGSGASVTSLVVHPTEPSTTYAGSGSGVFKSTNGGRTWSPMNNGLTSRSVLSLVIDPSTPSTIYALVADFSANRGVYKSTDGGSSWVRRSNGLVGQEFFSLIIDPAAPNTLYVGVGCCISGSHVYKTTDGADNWAPVATAPSQVPTVLAIDPLDHATIYASDAATPGNIYKSTNSGATWQSLGSTVLFARSIAVSPHTAGLVYAQTDQTLFKSTDGGNSWSAVPSRTGKIVFDPVSPSTLYLLTNPNSSNAEGVLKSTDSGQTWTPMNKGLKSTGVVALAIDPLKPSTVYLASTNPFNSTDAFVTKINAAGSALIYSTFMGGATSQNFTTFNSQAFGIAVDTSGNAYITGVTSSAGYPVTPDSYQPFVRGSNDAFVSKLSMSFIISGHVLNNGVTPLAGAEVVLNDGSSLTSVLTENDGSYQFARLREGGNYTITANKPHFTMTPASQTFNNLNSDQVQDFSAFTSDSEFFTIGGEITENGASLPGVTVTLSGSQSSVKTTDSSGNYSFELIVGGNYTVTPTILGFNFSPTSQTFNSLSANQTANFAATRQSFVVTNNNNHGAGSLREAIINANATPGTDTITFNIPGSGVKTISVLTALPAITDRVVIDAATQPGYAGAPLIELDGLGLAFIGGDGLSIKAGGSTVRGLSIGNFRGGSGISLNACDNNLIQGNYIGVAANGTTAKQNSRGIQLTNSSNNVIGGTSAQTRNVISGNQGNGIDINVGNANVIQGNFIGTNAAGTASLSNFAGVIVSGAPSLDNLIGGTTPGAGNLISGNNFNGIIASGNGTLIQGNLIGTDVTGVNKIPNSSGIQATAQNVLIGGLTPGARNVISGNQGDGVYIRGTGNKVQGNFIGTDITGTLPLGNFGNGVVAGESVVIGGTVPEARNIIAANGSFGNVALGLNNSGSAATVQGNYIGTDVTGTKSVSGTGVGISILTSNHVIGGVVPGARNVISGNSVGIQIGGFFSGTVGNLIQGNFIGLNAAGTGPLGNKQSGIQITDGVNNTIGGTQIEAANKIAFNGSGGVVISGNGQGNSIRSNSIFSNNGLGIDLGANGVTANDGSDPDTGANNLQNFPVITAVLSGSNTTTIQGTLKSLPNTTFSVDFYSNGAVDPSGNGEGAQFFQNVAVHTDGNGDASFSETFSLTLPAGRVITATATDPNGNTSEFSAANSTNAVGSVQFSVSSLKVIEDIGTLSLTVLRTGGTSGDLTVDYSTANGTAIAGQDYTSTSGTLTFTGGESSKTIQIPILDNSTTENDETFTVTLLNNSNIEVLGAPNTLVLTVQDHDTTPTIVVESINVLEGNAGTTTNAVFTISLSAATGRAVSVNFATVNSGASGGSSCNNPGVDYESASGTLSFTPSVMAFSIPIKICGDNNAEANEAFGVGLSNPIGATLPIPNFAFIVIEDDDPLNLLLEESGPIAGQAAALDALLGLRDPFRVQGIPDWFSTGGDRNTRVAFFVRNLQLNPGESPSAVGIALMQNSSGLFHFVSSEAVKVIPNSEFTQVVVRLPNTLVAGTYTVQIFAHSRTTNTGTIRIVP
ncbi:MAG TPA: SBBP repeat-containing protein [Pyrinomonadaceae bacterium]|nr:SBBP repeat-containing protein [Pyrinomonadaceae bacterium]